jgi:hypothetical protein
MGTNLNLFLTTYLYDSPIAIGNLKNLIRTRKLNLKEQ